MKVIILALLFVQSLNAQTSYESNIIFYGYSSNNPAERFVSNFTTDIDDHCDANGKFAIVVHGWDQNFNKPWVSDLLQNFLKYRGGCVLFMDYDYYARMDYFSCWLNFGGISAVLLKKIKQIGRYDRLYLFGMSFGSRLCEDAGLKLGNQLIDRMDLCEPAAPLFNWFRDPKPAAKNVACINLTILLGTPVYNCHQNFRMGFCGYLQPASNVTLIMHGLCTFFFNSAFTHDFVPNNLYNCHSERMIKNVSSNVMMGYRADFDRVANRGDIFIATAMYYPFVVVNGDVDNKP